jgi:hypothetical protein
MKKLLIASILSLAIVGYAAEPKSGPQTLSLPATLTGTTNLASPLLVDASGQQNVRFLFGVSSADSASTTNVTFKAAYGVSATQLDTNNAITLTANISGSTVFYTATNVIASNGGLKLYIYQEAAGANSRITNNYAAWLLKTQAP